MDPSAQPNGEPTAERTAPTRLIIEIGAGRPHAIRTAWQPITENRHFAPGEQYIGLDIGSRVEFDPDKYPGVARNADTVMHQRWNDITASRPYENIAFIQADGEHLPFPDNAADEAILSNVIGYGANPAAWPGLVSEANRTIKEDGEMIFHDDQSPHHTSLSTMTELLDKAGLQADAKRMRLVRKADDPDAFDQLTQKHGFFNDPQNPDGVIWVINKLETLPPEPVEENEASAKTPNPLLRLMNRYLKRNRGQ